MSQNDLSLDLIRVIEKKNIFYAFCFLRGIGFYSLKKRLLFLGLDKHFMVANANHFLSTFESEDIIFLKNFYNTSLENSRLLDKELKFLVNRLVKLGHRRGKRLMLGLPVNGQRSHTNASTVHRMFSKFH